MDGRKTRAIADGDLVGIHSRVQLERGARPVAVVHISASKASASQNCGMWASHSQSTCQTNTGCPDRIHPPVMQKTPRPCGRGV